MIIMKSKITLFTFVSQLLVLHLAYGKQSVTRKGRTAEAAATAQGLFQLVRALPSLPGCLHLLSPCSEQ